jgi:imidazolonepropionase-like amidohydrolase
MKPLLLLVVSISFITANAQLLIRNTSIVDVENKKILPQQNVLIENGIITDIGKNIKISGCNYNSGWQW